MLKSIIGKKIGMTQIFDEKGILVPVTVVEAGPCTVTGIRTKDKDGYNAVQLGFGDAKKRRLTKAREGFFKKINLSPKKTIKEFRISNVDECVVGQEVTVDVFKKDDYVDVSALTKGKGFAGVIKRHNFGKQPVSRGQSDRTRARGSSGGQGPQKVLKGMRMSGHLGNEYVTMRRLRVVNVDVANNILLIKGSIPAVRTGIVLINVTIKRIPVMQETKVKARKK